MRALRAHQPGGTAAAVPMVALTAQQALFDHGRLAPGQPGKAVLLVTDER